MSRKLTTAPEVAETLRSIRGRLKPPGAGAGKWETFRADWTVAKRNLRTYPYLGSESDDHPGRRQLVVSGGYRVIYTLSTREPEKPDRPYRGFQGISGESVFRVLAWTGYRVYRVLPPDTGDGATAGDIEIIAIFFPGQP